jgi:RNA polymerase sigma factor (TIGR02999 family)
MSRSSPRTITNLLLAWQKGDATALDRLTRIVYNELLKLARRHLRKEHSATLQTNELINEAYLRLLNYCGDVRWQDRAHFFAMAAIQMRRVLVDEARKRHVLKRGGQFTQVSLAEAMSVSDLSNWELIIAVHEVLERLAFFSTLKAHIVELRFFGGLTIEETAAALGISIDKVKREWRTAILWLTQELNGGNGNGGSRSVG